MDLKLFDALMTTIEPKQFGQQPQEWRTFMGFAYSYFSSRGIEHPVVVEIGVWTGHQKRFYEMIMGAHYIGIDFNPDVCADIPGNSQDQWVYDALLKMLHGRPIDLLFIDGAHDYTGVKSDYLSYGPLTKHIVALHDIGTLGLPSDIEPVEVREFWHEVEKTDLTNTLMTIRHHNPAGSGQFSDLADGERQMNIGLIINP